MVASMKKEREWIAENASKPSDDEQYNLLQTKVKTQYSEILKLTLTIKKKDIRIKQLEDEAVEIKKERDRYKQGNGAAQTEGTTSKR